MNNNTTIKKEAILSEFVKRFNSRLNMLEQFYQIHNGEPWEGKTIPEWLNESLDSLIATAREETFYKILEEYQPHDLEERKLFRSYMYNFKQELKQSLSELKGGKE